MTEMTARDLDGVLRKLIDEPGRLDEVKRDLQKRFAKQEAPARASRGHYDDLDDMFDNLPV